jgi:hypothetical protein
VRAAPLPGGPTGPRPAWRRRPAPRRRRRTARCRLSRLASPAAGASRNAGARTYPGGCGGSVPHCASRVRVSLGGELLVLRQEFRRRGGGLRWKAGECCLVAVHRLQFGAGGCGEGGPEAGGRPGGAVAAELAGEGWPGMLGLVHGGVLTAAVSWAPAAWPSASRLGAPGAPSRSAARSCAVPAPASRRAMPPSAVSASLRRCRPLAARPAANSATVAVAAELAAAEPDSAEPSAGAPEDGGAEEGRTPADGADADGADAAADSGGAGGGCTSGQQQRPGLDGQQRHNLVHRRRRPERRPRRPSPDAASSCPADRSSRASSSAAARACSEKGGSAGAGGSGGIRAKPRLRTRRAASEKTAYRK